MYNIINKLSKKLESLNCLFYTLLAQKSQGMAQTSVKTHDPIWAWLGPRKIFYTDSNIFQLERP